MPQFADTFFGVDSGFRRAMAAHGLLFRLNVLPRYAQNLLDGPVPASQQVYVGQRATLISGVNSIFTADLRQWHLRHAQLNAGYGWRWSSWQPASPNTIAVTSLYVFKGWGDRRVEMKVGYLPNDLEFVGLQVGGSTTGKSRSVLPTRSGCRISAAGAVAHHPCEAHATYQTGAQRAERRQPVHGGSETDRSQIARRQRPSSSRLVFSARERVGPTNLVRAATCACTFTRSPVRKVG